MTHLANIVTRPRPVKELSAVFDIVCMADMFSQGLQHGTASTDALCRKQKKKKTKCFCPDCAPTCAPFMTVL